MQHTRSGKLGKSIHYFFLNIHYVVIFILVFLFLLNITFYKYESTEYTDILLDKTFENVDEIYINNDFGKSFILKVPQRSRVIVQKKEIGESNTFLIRIDVLK